MKESRYTNPKITKQVQVIWEELGKTSIDSDGVIQEDFGGFPAGTNREDIWHWIECTFDISVHDDLMFPNDHSQKTEA